MNPPPLKLAYLSIGRHIHTERWLRWFADRGHEVHLLTVQPGPMPGITVHDITSHRGPKPFRYLQSLIKVKSLLKQLNPDLLHTHFLTGYGYWGVFSGWHPFMLTVWGDDVYVTPDETPLKKRLARHALKSADYVTGDSKDILEACIRMGASADRAEVVQWGVDFDVFRPRVGGAEVREGLGIPPQAPVVLSTRSFTQPYYNIDLVVKTAPLVRNQFPDVHYIIAGNEGDDVEFRREAEDVGLRDQVHWVGRIPHGELAAHVNACDVFLTIPSVDATAVSMLEAMACERAIVATNLPSAAEWIVDDRTGITVTPRNEQELVQGILRFLGDADLRRRLGAKAGEYVRQHADHNRNMQRVEDIYYALVRHD